jgi:hypothetical protein
VLFLDLLFRLALALDDEFAVLEGDVDVILRDAGELGLDDEVVASSYMSTCGAQPPGDSTMRRSGRAREDQRRPSMRSIISSISESIAKGSRPRGFGGVGGSAGVIAEVDWLSLMGGLLLECARHQAEGVEKVPKSSIGTPAQHE